MYKDFLFFLKLQRLAALFALFLLLVFSTEIFAQGGLGTLIGKLTNSGVDAYADSIEVVGTNLIGSGHAVVKYERIFITADKIIVDFESWNVEAVGNVRFIRREKKEKEIDLWELEDFQKDPAVKLDILGYVTTHTGKQRISVQVEEEKNIWEGKRAEGNIKTGYFNLGEYKGRFDEYYCIGKAAEREPDASITISDATVSTCEYLLENHEHYSITASRVRLIPDKGAEDFAALKKGGQEKYSVWAYNCVIRIGDVPVMWVPFLYKPSSGTFGWQIQAGKDHDWGYYVKTRKTFNLCDYPYVTGTLLADWYSKHGFGVGTQIKASTDNSFTDAFIYWIYDKDPQQYEGRFNIDSNRYDLYLSHLNHLTPRLDFRGHIEALSDINFISDFFRRRNQTDPQPTSFADLEYQFDHFTLSANVKPRINDFFTVMERLPELRLDVQRQELFSNIYYQGQTTFDYLMMKWRNYDKPREAGNKVEPKDYQSARFDTLHMFYYPFSADWLNLIPRAGVRLTYYSKSSKTKIDQQELDEMYIVDNDGQGDAPGDVVNYDGHGGGKFRVAGELGLEANTKIYRSWNDYKSPFLELDGLRHVMAPYLNYTFIPKPSVDRNKLYYFDDIDRIKEQNFVRLGIKNRLQTRRGNYKKQDIYTWASMENYVDFHFNQEDNFKHMGDFGTIFEFNPTSDLKIVSDILIDVGNGKFSKFRTDFIYNITQKWKLFAKYNYQGNYEQRNAYSMGSSLTDITAGTSFQRRFTELQEISGGIEFPIMDKTRVELSTTYNIYYSSFEEAKVRVVRNLHCWELALEYALRQRNTSMGEKQNQNNFMFSLYLTAAPSVKIEAKESMGGEDGGGDGSANNGGGGGGGVFGN